MVKYTTLLIILFISCFKTLAQKNTYEISFSNAAHHEAQITLTIPHIKQHTITARMSRSSPGRYAIHEFAKNVYDVRAVDSKGDTLHIHRPDPYSWEISGHDGTVNLTYTLFANRADGTYSQIDESHAHLNMPATFMWIDEQEHRPVEIKFSTRQDLNWKIATQLKKLNQNTFSAPDLHYFMDSPTELSNFDTRSFKLDGQEIIFALHHSGTPKEFDTYFDQVKRIVHQEKAVYGELPNFDYDTYTFIACYLPHVSGDGMEHRNSTILTDKEGLAQGGMKGNIGTVSHEFFHAWNVERIRPKDLEPFNFKEANMTGALWFAEGFTSYYTNLILCRAGILTQEEYIKGLAGSFNYVWNSPGTMYHNPIEMSYQAPFVDAATSIDPVNRSNTFISYYSYGSVLGLALDLSLRQKNLSLDEYMQRVWQNYGINEVSYSIKDLEKVLADYAGNTFAKHFFTNYIYSSKMPDYKELLNTMGVALLQNTSDASLQLSLKPTQDGFTITSNSKVDSAAYKAGLEKGDTITTIDGKTFKNLKTLTTYISNKDLGDTINITYKRLGESQTTSLALEADKSYSFQRKKKTTSKELKKLNNWLKAK